MPEQRPDAISSPAAVESESLDLKALANLVALLARENGEEAIAQAFLAGLPAILPVTFRALSLRKRDYWWTAGYRQDQPLSARWLDRIASQSQRVLAREILSVASPQTQVHQAAPHAVLIDPQRSALNDLNAGPLLATAIRTKRTDFGILLIGKGRETHYTPDEHLRLHLVADQLAYALETASLYADTVHRDREISLIYQTGQRITQLLDLPQLMPQLVAAISETFGYESVNLLLVDEAAHRLVCKASYGLHNEQHLSFSGPIVDALEAGIVGWVAYHGKPYLAPDVLKEKRYIKTVEETRSELAVPVKIKGRVLGVLDVESRIVGGVTDKDRYIVETLADQVAVALENARLYEDLSSAHRQLQRLLERTVHIQEQERRRIAADIHDDINQLLYAAMYEAEAVRQSLPSDMPAAIENLRSVQTSLNQALTEIRRVIFDLWPSSLDEVGLLHAVQSLLNKFAKDAGVNCRLRLSGKPIAFAPRPGITVYRILQEALYNVQKHARATVVTVSVSFRRERVAFHFWDNGVGFSPVHPVGEEEDHLGLISMRERARSIGGQLQVKSVPGAGTLISFDFPLEAVADPAPQDSPT